MDYGFHKTLAAFEAVANQFSGMLLFVVVDASSQGCVRLSCGVIS